MRFFKNVPFIVKLAIAISLISIAVSAAFAIEPIRIEFAKSRFAKNEITGILVPANCRDVTYQESIKEQRRRRNPVCWIGLSEYRKLFPYFKGMSDQKLLHDAYLDNAVKEEATSPWLVILDEAVVALAVPVFALSFAFIFTRLFPGLYDFRAISDALSFMRPGRIAKWLLILWAISAVGIILRECYFIFKILNAAPPRTDNSVAAALPPPQTMMESLDWAGTSLLLALGGASFLLVAGFIIYWLAKLTFLLVRRLITRWRRSASR